MRSRLEVPRAPGRPFVPPRLGERACHHSLASALRSEGLAWNQWRLPQTRSALTTETHDDVLVRGRWPRRTPLPLSFQHASHPGRETSDLHRVFPPPCSLLVHARSAAEAVHYLAAHPVGGTEPRENAGRLDPHTGQVRPVPFPGPTAALLQRSARRAAGPEKHWHGGTQSGLTSSLPGRVQICPFLSFSVAHRA
jgi:hypothetical protein